MVCSRMSVVVVALLVSLAGAQARKAPAGKENGSADDCINLAELAKDKAKELGADLSTVEQLLEDVVGEEDMSIVRETLASAAADEKVATIFAPSDKAFKAALKKLGVTKEDLMENKALVGQILKFHIVPGQALMAADLAKMDGEKLTTALDGEELMVKVDGKKVKLMPDGGDKASAVTVQKADIETCHTVVHVIDGVLLPSDLDLGAGGDDTDAAESGGDTGEEAEEAEGPTAAGEDAGEDAEAVGEDAGADPKSEDPEADPKAEDPMAADDAAAETTGDDAKEEPPAKP